MDQNNRDHFGTGSNTGSGIGAGSSNFGASGTGSSGIGDISGFNTSSASDRGIETCAHCGQPLHGHSGLEQFLGRIGISEEMINNLKTQMGNVDIEQYLDTARDYLKNAGNTVKGGSSKATEYAKDNPGKIAAGVAVLAVGAGLLINSLRNRDDREWSSATRDIEPVDERNL